MMIPTVHLNGTGRTSLLGELEAAYQAVDAAIDAVRNVTVHGRDYYVQDEGAYGRARLEMSNRLAKLDSVKTDLLTLYRGVLQQGKDKPR